MSFLPAGYELPTNNKYMRFKTGKNKFRVLGSAITGYEWWTEDGDKRKPMRVKTMQEAMRKGQEPIKHFWAFPVWNYQENQVQVLEVTQKSIMNAIKALTADDEWGDPKEYDITVTREGDGFDTEYHTMPSPAKPLEAEVKKMLSETSINLEALYEGGDPFEATDLADEVDRVLK